MGKNDWGGIILTPKCSNFCIFCREFPKLSPKELRKQEISVARNLSYLRKQGIKRIDISGNDPIEYDGIVPLIKYIKEIGFEYVQLSTHARRLSEETFLKELVYSGVDKIRIPVYGSSAEIHDSVTRAENSFSETLAGLKNLLDMTREIDIQISSLILENNRSDLEGIMDLVKNLGINDFYFSVPYVIDNDYSYYIPLKDLKSPVRKCLRYAKETGFPLKFMEIPYCVLGEFSDSINNVSSPPNLGKYCQPPKELRSGKKDWPSYRIKIKTVICDECECSDFCDGFILDDIRKFGIGGLEPVKKSV